MDYVTIKQLLLSPKPLVVDTAYEIIDFWQKYPRLYKMFLNLKPGLNFRYLECYQGYNEQTQMHVFDTCEIKVPSDMIALKFFACNDDSLSSTFMEFVYSMVAEQIEQYNIVAFPYLNAECCHYFGRDFISDQIREISAVFNFEQDTSGELYDQLLKLVDTEYEGKLLAANSFNTFGWLAHKSANRLYSNISLRKIFEHFAISMHAFSPNFNEEASFRKLYISFSDNIDKGVNKLIYGTSTGS